MAAPEFRKPIFNFIWVRSPTTPPTQVRFIRVGGRGLFRMAGLIVGTLSLATFGSITVAYLVTVREAIASTVLGALLATVSVVVFRSWILGTYVNDNGIKIIRIAATDAIPWTSVKSIDSTPTGWRCVGIPCGITTLRVVIKDFDGSLKKTHIFMGSIDGIFTMSKFSELKLFIIRWWRAE